MLLRGDTELCRWPLLRAGRPGLDLVDELARWQLHARRLGCAVELRDACVEFWGLLRLTGLAEIVSGEGGPPDR